MNQYQVRQSLEEYCRQADPNLLSDPLLTDFKTNLMDCMVQTVGETAAEDVVVAIDGFLPSPRNASRIRAAQSGNAN